MLNLRSQVLMYALLFRVPCAGTVQKMAATAYVKFGVFVRFVSIFLTRIPQQTALTDRGTL